MLFSGDKKASVIIYCGNSLAVALRYNNEIDDYPVVVAKARGLKARILKNLAQYDHIPINENPQLARSLISLKVNQYLPQAYWEAVANILAGIFNKNKQEDSQKNNKRLSSRKTGDNFFDLFQYVYIRKIALETGKALSGEKTASLQEKINEVRIIIAAEFGIVLPFVDIRYNEKIESDEYRIIIKNIEAARDKVQNKALSEITDRLQIIVKQNVAEFTGFQETYDMLSSFSRDNPELIEKVFEIYDVSEINTVLKNLLAEQVSIRNLSDILETLICREELRKNLRLLTEMVRAKLGAQICMQYAEYIDGEYTLFTLNLDPKLEQIIVDSEFETTSGLVAALNPEIDKKWQEALSSAVEFAQGKNHAPVIVCGSKARYLVKESSMRNFPGLAVLAHEEIKPSIRCESLLEITLPQEFMPEPKVSDALEELESLTGLAEVKKQIGEIKRFIERRGKEALPSLHMVFRGNPETGKTIVARLVGKIFSELGVLKKKNVFIETGREGLVAKYVGQTAIKTAKQCKAAMGGVLFIDEAYTLGMSGHENDFGHECIATLVKYLENRRSDFVCIMAGYSDQMDVMIKRNPGLKDRVQFYIDFPDYTVEELLQIFKYFCNNVKLVMDQSAETELFSWLVQVKKAKQEYFSNARMVRKLFERTQIQQALRTGDNVILPEDLEAAISSKDMAEFIREPGVRIGF